MSSGIEIRAPAEQTEGTRSQVLRWLKAVGDEIVENEPLIEIETDKVTVEVAAPASGVLTEILKQEQEEVDPGELLGRIDGVAPVGSRADATSLSAGGSAAGALAARAPARARETTANPGQAVNSTVGRSAVSSLSPAVRRLLAERGLDAAAIQGSGQGGRITVEDVLQQAPESARTPDSPAEVSGTSRRIPHSAVRRRIAEHMVQSLRIAPHVTTVFEANLSAVLEHRQRCREEFASRGVPLTLTSYFLQAAVAAIRAVPEANSRWTDTALEVFDSIHIGVATALDAGLIVPVLRDVQAHDLFETARALHELVTRAREGRLTPADMRGGTFTISNHGVSGSLVATPIIINQPQSAILGVGKLEQRVVPGNVAGADRIALQPRCYVTLTIDHRVMDGHQANRFLQTFVHRLETSPP